MQHGINRSPQTKAKPVARTNEIPKRCEYRPSSVPGGYEALWHGEWARIDPSAVLNRADNPTGRPVLCVRYFNGHPIARCFIRPAEG